MHVIQGLLRLVWSAGDIFFLRLRSESDTSEIRTWWMVSTDVHFTQGRGFGVVGWYSNFGRFFSRLYRNRFLQLLFQDLQDWHAFAPLGSTTSEPSDSKHTVLIVLCVSLQTKLASNPLSNSIFRIFNFLNQHSLKFYCNPSFFVVWIFWNLWEIYGNLR